MTPRWHPEDAAKVVVCERVLARRANEAHQHGWWTPPKFRSSRLAHHETACVVEWGYNRSVVTGCAAVASTMAKSSRDCSTPSTEVGGERRLLSFSRLPAPIHTPGAAPFFVLAKQVHRKRDRSYFASQRYRPRSIDAFSQGDKHRPDIVFGRGCPHFVLARALQTDELALTEVGQPPLRSCPGRSAPSPTSDGRVARRRPAKQAAVGDGSLVASEAPAPARWL